MSILDALTGKALHGIDGGGMHAGLAGEVLNLLGGGQGGGLAKLAQSFEGRGLGNIVQSWISTGSNLPVSPDQIASVLGNPQMAQLAAKFGLAPEDVATHLSQMLPKIVDTLTPKGSIPESDGLQEALSLLRQRLG